MRSETFSTWGVTLAMSALAHAQGVEVDKAFQAHGPDGRPYWVVVCIQADRCFEAAYQQCHGSYTPMDKLFNPTAGFRFVCSAHPSSAKADPKG